MRVRPLLLAFLVLLISFPVLADRGDTAFVLQEARKLAESKKYDEALALLEKAQNAMPSNAEVRLAKIRTLSWMGRYEEAQRELDIMPPSQKTNADVWLLQAYLHYYRKEFTDAESVFLKILAAHPDYTDAAEGLANVRRAMQGNKKDDVYKWQADAGYEYSHFSRRNQKAWHQQFIQINRFFSDRKTVVHGRVERYNQFSNIDSAYQVGASHVFMPRFTGYLSGSISPGANFRPDWRISAGGAARLDAAPDLPAIWLTLDARRDGYANTDVLTMNPGLKIEPVDGWAVSGRVITVGQRSEDRLYGQELRLDGQVAPGWRFRAGYADAPETESGVTVDTATVYGGISVDVLPTLTLHFGYTRDDRENSYIRNVYNVAFSRKF
ncbi:MAG: YaiO family outer membrane beta-barrel protein [Alphaproteobacteria bacterium]|nr:YaiO family outer membrane beta-barrel protein [Alphaproteobacteria bacterium]